MKPPTDAEGTSGPDFAEGLDRATYHKHLPLVRRVALRTAQSLPKGLTYDDVLRAGFEGLVSALRSRGAATDDEFLTFAAYRVRLAVLEFLKDQDPEARQMKAVSSRISSAIHTLCKRIGRVPEEHEVADELGLNLATYHSLLERIAKAGWVRLELQPNSRSETASEGIMGETARVTGRIEQIILGLPDTYQVVLGLYYQEQCEFGEISDVLGVTEARAIQLHAQAVHLIRGQLTEGVLS